MLFLFTICEEERQEAAGGSKVLNWTGKSLPLPPPPPPFTATALHCTAKEGKGEGNLRNGPDMTSHNCYHQDRAHFNPSQKAEFGSHGGGGGGGGG